MQASSSHIQLQAPVHRLERRSYSSLEHFAGDKNPREWRYIHYTTDDGARRAFAVMVHRQTFIAMPHSIRAIVDAMLVLNISVESLEHSRNCKILYLPS